MEKNELENAIMAHLLQIRDLLKQYSLDAISLNVHITDESINAFNRYWEEETKVPINMFRLLEYGGDGDDK